MNKYKLRKHLRGLQAQSRALALATTPTGEPRSLTADEQAQLATLAAQIDEVNARLDALEQAEADRDGDQADGDEAETRDGDQADGDQADEPEPSRRSAPAPAASRAGPPAATGRRSTPIEGRPAARTGAPRPYSVLRAMRCMLESRRLDGLEGELSQELARRAGREPEGFFMPIGTEPEFRGMIAPTVHVGPGVERRDTLNTTTGAGTIFTTPELPFIELLRAKLVMRAMGAQFLTGMQGKFSIPRQTAGVGAAWILEGAALTPNNQAMDQVPLVDKTLGAATTLTRKFIYQTSLDAEAFVRNDLAASLATELDRAAINGSGSGATPLGILQNTAIQTASASLALGANGGAPTLATIIGLESLVATANATGAAPKYLTSPAGRGRLKATPKIGTTYPLMLWGDQAGGNGVGELNSYEAHATTNVPSNLVKGSASNCTAIIFGNWADLIIAQWGGIDVMVNPFTGQLSGSVTISMMMEADVAVRHAESFAIVSDVTPS